MRRRGTLGLTILATAAAIALVVGARIRATDTALNLTAFSTNFNNPVGIDFYEPLNQLLVSVNHPSGWPNNLDLIDADGVHTAFSALFGQEDEIKIATVRSGACTGGFQIGDVFVGNGVPGQIARVTDNGATVINPWVILPGETVHIRGSLFQDRYCAFGGDLIVVTGDSQPSVTALTGNVWRVNAAGVATLVATLDKHLEGVVTVPNDPVKYGPMAGRILVGDEDRTTGPHGPYGKIFAIRSATDIFTIARDVDPTYTSAPYLFPNYPASHAVHPEDLDIIPKADPNVVGDGNFFGVDYGNGRILTAPASDFAGSCGDILVTREYPNEGPYSGTSGLSVLRWNPSSHSFDVEPLTTPNYTPVQWEHVTFRGGADCRTCTGVIGDFVWKDLNNDGHHDAGEPGFPGIPVTLTSPDVPEWRITVQTNQTGHYQFTGLCAGTYTVTVTPPAGDSLTTSNPRTVVFGDDGGSDLSADFGIDPPGVIGDLVWLDVNANGIQDAGEPGIPGVTVHLKAGAFSASGPDIAATTTDASGQYRFQNLDVAGYTVVADAPAGYTASPSNGGSNPAIDSNFNPASLTLTDAAPVDLTIDFGFSPPCTGQIGNFVWNDANLDGIQGAGEPGIANVPVKLTKPNLSVVVTATDANGAYLFTGLCAGTYSVKADLADTSLPSPWTSQDIGTVGVAGSATISGGTITVKGSGADIWNGVDGFRYASRPLNGDGAIVARIASQTNTNGWAKAGVMIRNSTSANSAYAGILVTPSNGIVVQHRPSDGGASSFTQVAGSVPRWLKLVRTGSTIDAFVSSDGSTWTAAGTVTVALNASVSVGLAVSSHANAVLGVATFDNVKTTEGSATSTLGLAIPSGLSPTAINAGGNPTLDSNATPSSVTLASDAASDLTVDFGFVSGQPLCQPAGSSAPGPAGTLSWNTLANGDISIRYDQARTVNDNTYGTGAIGWSRGHTFSNLTGSDKAEFKIKAADGTVVLDFYSDYISAKSGTPSGYASLGPDGGDGSMVSGLRSNIVSFTSSLARNLNEKGYCAGGNCSLHAGGVNLLVNSPAASASYVADDPYYANWNFTNSFEVTVKASAFGTSGFGSASVAVVHNSPAKSGSNAITPVPCTSSDGTGTGTGTTGSCSQGTAIASSFNSTPIAAGRHIWFSSALKVSGLGSAPVTVKFRNQTIAFTANSTLYTLPVKDANVTFSPTATAATTTFNTTTNAWETTVPASVAGDVFLSGLPYLVPANLPGSLKNVTWSGQITSATGTSVQWKWAAAVYSSFSSDLNALGVKPVASSTLSAYHNSDNAGTPEAFKPYVIAGAKGSGGSSYTGSYSSSKTTATCR